MVIACLSLLGTGYNFYNKCPADYFLGWGSTGDRLWVQVKTVDLMSHKPNRLMFVGRAGSNAIDQKSDTSIVRSATFEIQPEQMRMEAFVTPEFVKAYRQAGALTEECILEVPADFPIEAVHSLGEAEKRGAEILGCKSGVLSRQNLALSLKKHSSAA